jgi:hypothetical protein
LTSTEGFLDENDDDDDDDDDSNDNNDDDSYNIPSTRRLTNLPSSTSRLQPISRKLPKLSTQSSSRLQKILDGAPNSLHQEVINPSISRRKRPLQPLPQTFYSNDMSYEDYFSSSRSRSRQSGPPTPSNLAQSKPVRQTAQLIQDSHNLSHFSPFPLLCDSLRVFKPYHDSFLLPTLSNLNIHTLSRKSIKALYQECLRLHSVPIPHKFSRYMRLESIGFKSNLPVINDELQFAYIPALEKPSIQLMSILSSAFSQRGNSHSLIIGTESDAPLLCVGSVLGHLLYNQDDRSKLSVIIIHLSGNISTDDTVCMRSLCLQLCEQLGLTCSLNQKTANFHDYAQFISFLLKQIAILDVTGISNYDTKYNLYEHNQNPRQNQSQNDSNKTESTKESHETIHSVPIVILLDGFDNFARTGVSIDDNTSKGVSRQSFLYFVGDLAQTNQAWLHVIGIANSPTSYDYLEKRVKSRLPMQNIFLHNSLCQIPIDDKNNKDKNNKDQNSIYNFNATSSISLMDDSKQLIERIQAVLYQLLALPCEPIDNKPIAVVEKAPPTLSLINSNEIQVKAIVSTQIVEKSSPTHYDGEIGLSSLLITPRNWSSIDLTRDSPLPHWTQVFYYNASLYLALTSDYVAREVILPISNGGMGFMKMVQMVGAIIDNMVNYPTLLLPNTPPVLQFYSQYCLKIEKSLEENKNETTNGVSFKYLSQWRGTSAISTLLLTPWDILTAFFYTTQQVNDYQTTYCELRNELLTKSHLFNSNTITDQTIIPTLFTHRNPSPSAPSSAPGTPKKKGRQAAKLTNSANLTDSIVPLNSSGALNIPTRSEYVIDTGFLSRLLRFFESDLTHKAHYLHFEMDYETNSDLFNRYLVQVATEHKQFQSYFLPNYLDNLLKDDQNDQNDQNDKTNTNHPLSFTKEDIITLCRKYFPTHLSYFPSTIPSLQSFPNSIPSTLTNTTTPSPVFKIISLSVEPDPNQIDLLHKQQQAFKKSQIQQRQVYNSHQLALTDPNGGIQTNITKLDANSSQFTLQTIFKVFLQVFQGNFTITPTNFIYSSTIDPLTPEQLESMSISESTPLTFHQCDSLSLQPTQNDLSASVHSTSSKPQKLRAAPLTPSTPLHSVLNKTTLMDSLDDSTQVGLAQKTNTLVAPEASLNKPTISLNSFYFHTELSIYQQLSRLPCHSLGLIGAALRLERRGGREYNFAELYREHLAFLHAFGLNQTNINTDRLYINPGDCFELYEQLLIDGVFVYGAVLPVDITYAQQLNLDVFLAEEGNESSKKLAVINTAKTSQIMTLHPYQHQFHSSVKLGKVNNKHSSNTVNDVTVLSDGTNGGNSSAIESAASKAKIHCVLTHGQFFTFLKEFKIHLNAIRYTFPLDYESVPIWVDSLLDAEINTVNSSG